MFLYDRYILLDAPLLFCIAATVWTFTASWTHEKSEKRIVQWWLWNCGCGFFLACSISVKFVGLFVVFWVGLITIARILFFWSKTSGKSLPDIAKELTYRAICLICLPIGCYVCFYGIHFQVLNHSGVGDGFYSSAFQVWFEYIGRSNE